MQHEDNNRNKTTNEGSFITMPLETVCMILSEFNNWRRGIGKYSFSEDPSKNVECPFTPCEIGIAIDAAVSLLKKRLQ